MEERPLWSTITQERDQKIEANRRNIQFYTDIQKAYQILRIL